MLLRGECEETRLVPPVLVEVGVAGFTSDDMVLIVECVSSSEVMYKFQIKSAILAEFYNFMTTQI